MKVGKSTSLGVEMGMQLLKFSRLMLGVMILRIYCIIQRNRVVRWTILMDLYRQNTNLRRITFFNALDLLKFKS